MKREPYYRNLLGGTQEEMSMLLNISRSHWAKIELGTRMPSTKIQLALSEMAKHAENRKAGKTPSAPNAPQLKQHLELLGRMLRENEYQQAVTVRKIAAVGKKQDAQLKLAVRADYLNAKHAKNASVHAHHKGMAEIATRKLETDHSGSLMLHELRLEVLALEKKLLESKMLEITLRLGEKE
jgi:transcriptional regulator with XRE-family HTH domain